MYVEQNFADYIFVYERDGKGRYVRQVARFSSGGAAPYCEAVIGEE